MGKRHERKELLEIATRSRANFALLVTQVIAIHFAIIAGIYLFLGRAGRLQASSSVGLFASGWLIIAFALFAPVVRRRD